MDSTTVAELIKHTSIFQATVFFFLGAFFGATVGVLTGAMFILLIPEVKIFGRVIRLRDTGVYFKSDCTNEFIKYKSYSVKHLKVNLIPKYKGKFQEVFKSAIEAFRETTPDPIVNLEISSYTNLLDSVYNLVLVPSILGSIFENGFEDPDKKEFVTEVIPIVESMFKECSDYMKDKWNSTLITRIEYDEKYMKKKEVSDFTVDLGVKELKALIVHRNHIVEELLKKYPDKSESEVTSIWKDLFN